MMTKTKIVVISVGGVLGTVGSFLAGYFTGKKMERRRLLGDPQPVQQERDNGHQHAQA